MKVLLFMAKGVEMLEASAFIDVFGWYRDLNKGNIELVTCGFMEEVVSTFNLRFKVDLQLSEVCLADYEALLIPGGFGYYGFYEEAYDDRFMELIKAFHEAGKIIASVCVGALPMGKSEILKGRRATTYHLMNGRRQNQLREMGAEIMEEPVVVDGNLITSWCPATAPEVALKTLELLAGKEEADKIREMMGY